MKILKILKFSFFNYQFYLTHGTISMRVKIRGNTESLWNLECGVFQSDRSYEFYKEPFYQSYSSPRELSPSFIYANLPSNTNLGTNICTNLCTNSSTFKPSVINFCFIMTDFPRILIFSYIFANFLSPSFLNENFENISDEKILLEIFEKGPFSSKLIHIFAMC